MLAGEESVLMLSGEGLVLVVGVSTLCGMILLFAAPLLKRSESCLTRK
jgi:hypothetical protein